MDADKIDMDILEDDVQDDFNKSFGWFLVVNKICDNDFTKHEYVYNKKIMEVLNQLSYLVSWEQEQIKIQKKAAGHLI
jgi:hypothetical protein